jgi:hypothetical protein
MRRARNKCPPAACLGFFTASLFVTAPTQAAEYGFSDYLLGYSIPMAGYTPPPGVYFLNTFYLYSGSANVNAEFPFGRITAAGLTEHFAVNITTTAWYTDMTILGGTLGFAATIPFGSDTIPLLSLSSARWVLAVRSTGRIRRQQSAIRPSVPASAGSRGSIIGI